MIPSPLTKYPCPSCGYLVFNNPPGSDEICPICFWQDDMFQLRFPKETWANKVSLVDAQKNYETFGASEWRFKESVHIPTKDDIRDAEWRPIDFSIDNFEEWRTDGKFGPFDLFPDIKSPSENYIYRDYPSDLTQLYYWSDNYWRKK